LLLNTVNITISLGNEINIINYTLHARIFGLLETFAVAEFTTNGKLDNELKYAV
jgi:hypothetical protein